MSSKSREISLRMREKRAAFTGRLCALSLSLSLSLDWERYDRIYTIELYLVSSSHVII